MGPISLDARGLLTIEDYIMINELSTRTATENNIEIRVENAEKRHVLLKS